jgi:Holliday junction resolvase RusA-like endonuclease
MPTHRRVDLCNLHAALHDILVKYQVIEDDNSKIVVSTDGSRVLYDKDHPRTEVVITEVE